MGGWLLRGLRGWGGVSRGGGRASWSRGDGEDVRLSIERRRDNRVTVRSVGRIACRTVVFTKLAMYTHQISPPTSEQLRAMPAISRNCTKMQKQ